MVLPWYGKESLKSGVPPGWVIIYLLVLSEQFQPVLQSYSEVPGEGVGDGIAVFGGIVGLLAYRVQSMGWGCLSNLPVRSLPADWFEKLRQVGEVPEVLSWYLRPKE